MQSEQEQARIWKHKVLFVAQIRRWSKISHILLSWVLEAQMQLHEVAIARRMRSQRGGCLLTF